MHPENRRALFRERLADAGLPIEAEDAIEKAPESPPRQPIRIDFTVGNHYVIHPMEGWDAEADGQPSG
ncbi:MAG: hypothetical protein R2748_01435 [Bryobacterales bacterium]